MCWTLDITLKEMGMALLGYTLPCLIAHSLTLVMLVFLHLLDDQ